MLRSIAIAGLLLVGCKADKTEPAAGSSASTDNANADRSGKVDLGVKRQPQQQPALGANSKGHQLVQERRRERMMKMDTDGDGQISDEERKAARTKRAEDMRKRLDLDSDGKVSVDEISKSTFRRFDPEKVDANKDGNVTLDEIEAAMAERARAWGAGRGDRKRNGSGGGATVPAPTSPADPGDPE
jgi:hypothetical protein